VTRAFTAAAILTAGDVLALDAPVSRYVSGLTPCVGTPTLRQLLSHTGGLIDEPAEFGPQDEDGLGAYQRTWTSEYCLLPPGRAFSYSNAGFALAGLALQEVDTARFVVALMHDGRVDGKQACLPGWSPARWSRRVRADVRLGVGAGGRTLDPQIRARPTTRAPPTPRAQRSVALARLGRHREA
jgi:CubicO group peptidase (beta-lactamase class C family)